MYLGKKSKRIIAVILSFLILTSLIDYNGFVVSAEETSVASVTIPGAAPVSYTDFNTALAVAQSNSGSTLTLLKDADRSDQTITVVSGSALTIDTNGHTLSFYLGEQEKGISVEEGATFTLRGNSSESATLRGTPAIKSTTKSWGYWTYLIYTKGTCTIESAYVEGNEGPSRGVVMDGGSLTVKNSTIKGGGFSIYNKSGEVYFDALTTLEGQLSLYGRTTVNSGASMTSNTNGQWFGYFNTFCVNGTIGGNFTWNPNMRIDSKLITTVFTADDIQITDSDGNFPMVYTGNAIETKVFTKTITDRNGVTKEVMVDTNIYTQTFEKQETDSNWYEVTQIKDVGTYRVKYINGDSIITKEFTVAPLDLSGANVGLSVPEGGYTYDTTEKTPNVTATLNGNIIDPSQYDISYSNTNGGEGNHTNVGTVTVTITGKNNYTGTTNTTFSIAKADQNLLKINEVNDKKYGDADFMLATTGGSGTGEVTYSVPEKNGVLSISGNTVTIVGAGTVTVTATKAADSTYNEATASLSLTILNPTPSYGGPSTITTNVTQPGAGTPTIKDDDTKVANNKAGWEAIKEQVKEKNAAGESTLEKNAIKVDMNGSSAIPQDVLESLRGTDTTLILDMGNGITWSISGQSILNSSLEDINLAVKLDTDSISDNLIQGTAGKQPYRSISLSHDGKFGLTALLSINMEKKNAGHYANLFYYNPTSGKLELQSIEKVNQDGYIEYKFTHASDYVMVLSTEPMYAKAFDQITISTTKGTLYVGGTKNKSMKLKLEIPDFLKESMEKDSSQLVITYKSSNPKVATVTASGKIIAKKPGKARITTLVQICGSKKSFNTTIKVSKSYIKLTKSTKKLLG